MQSMSFFNQLRGAWPGGLPPEADIVFAVSRLDSLLHLQVDGVLSGFDLSYTHFRLLTLLRSRGTPHACMPTELCHALSLTSGGMTKVLDHLEKRALIVRLPKRHDKRCKLAMLTPAGEALAEEAMVAVGEKSRILVHNMLPMKERGVLREALLQSLVNLEAMG